MVFSMFISIIDSNKEQLKFFKEFMKAFFTDSDCIVGKMFSFFLNNYLLTFLLGFGFAYGAFSLLSFAFKASKIS